MTDDYSSALMTVWALYAFATLVPGPNAICVASSALLGGRARGLSAAAGVASATLLWAAIGVSGVAVALRARPEAMDVLQLAGATVLVWLGWATLRAAPGGARRGTRGGGYVQGLLTGCSNPISAAIWTASAGFVLATGPTAGEIAVYVTSCAALALGLHGTIALAVARLSRCRMPVAEESLRTLCGGAFIFLGAVVNGLVGFGFSAIAGAILIHPLDPLEAVPLMMAHTVIAQSIGAVRMRAALSLREVAPFCLGGLAGLTLTLPLLATLDPHAFHLAFGTFLLLYGAVALRTFPRTSLMSDVSRAERMAIGFVGGAIGALTALPSAAVVVWADRRGYGMGRLRATMQLYILTIQVAGLTGLWRAGLLDLDRLTPLFLTGLPALVLGHALGLRLHGRCDARRLRNAILSVVMVAGALMVAG